MRRGAGASRTERGVLHTNSRTVWGKRNGLGSLRSCIHRRCSPPMNTASKKSGRFHALIFSVLKQAVRQFDPAAKEHFQQADTERPLSAATYTLELLKFRVAETRMRFRFGSAAQCRQKRPLPISERASTNCEGLSAKMPTQTSVYGMGTALR